MTMTTTSTSHRKIFFSEGPQIIMVVLIIPFSLLFCYILISPMFIALCHHAAWHCDRFDMKLSWDFYRTPNFFILLGFLFFLVGFIFTNKRIYFDSRTNELVHGGRFLFIPWKKKIAKSSIIAISYRDFMDRGGLRLDICIRETSGNDVWLTQCRKEDAKPILQSMSETLEKPIVRIES